MQCTLCVGWHTSKACTLINLSRGVKMGLENTGSIFNILMRGDWMYVPSPSEMPLFGERIV